MFTQLGLQNFKAWRGMHTLDLKPLTLVLGVNSSGKTSLLQPLLLLKQTVESPDRLDVLTLGGQQAGEALELGAMKDILTGHDLSAPLAFRLRFGPVTIGGGIDARTLGSVDYEVDYKATEDGSPCMERMMYVTEDGAYGAARLPDGKYQLSAPNNPPLAGQRRAGRSFAPERSVGFSADAIAALGSDGPAAQDLALALTRELQQTAYLGPLRLKPQRHYVWTGQVPSQIGPSGEAAVPALLANLIRGDRQGANKGQLVRDVSTWIARLGIAEKVEVEQIGPVFYQVSVTIQGQKANLLDVGCGVSQVLPVVTLACFAPEGSLVILEQPELHLHPLAQAELAELLVETGRKRGLQFLIETHSEHLFRRLQTLIAAETLSPERCALYFLERDAGSSTLRTLDVDRYGRIKNWPARFFGDAMGETERQARQTIRRKQTERSHG